MKEIYNIIITARSNVTPRLEIYTRIKYFDNIFNYICYNKIVVAVHNVNNNIKVPYFRYIKYWQYDQNIDPIYMISRIYCSSGYIAGIKMLNFNDYYCLADACRNGHYDIVKYFLKSGNININHNRYGDNTCLTWAIFNGHYKIVKILIQYGIDIHHVICGNSYLHEASHGIYANLDIVQLLINEGIDVNYRNYDNLTALDMARMFNGYKGVDPKIIHLLERFSL